MRTVFCSLLLTASLAHAAPPITAAAFAPDGKSVVLGSQAGLAIHSWPGLEPLQTLKTEPDNVHDLAFSPDGELLLVAGGSPAESGQIEILRWPAGAPAAKVSAGGDVVYDVNWQADGSAFAAACGDRSVRLFVREGRELRRLEGN